MELGFARHNVLQRRVSKLLNEPPATTDKISQTGPTCLEKLVQLIHNIIFIIIIIIIPLLTLGSIYSTNSSGAEQMYETNNFNQT